MHNKHRSSRGGKTHAGNHIRDYIGYDGINSRAIFFSTKPRFEPHPFFRVLPSVRGYFRALKAIEKLTISEFTIQDIQNREFKGKATLSTKDEGFSDLVMILKKNGWLEDSANVEELVMHEVKGALRDINFMWLNGKIEGKERTVIASAELIPAIHILRETVNKFVQRKMDLFIVITTVVIFCITVFLVLYSNL